MHELALAEGVVVTALRAAEGRGLTKIGKITVRIGELQQIERELFEHALKEVLPATDERLTGAEIELQTEHSKLTCRVCCRSFSFSEATSSLSPDEAEAVHFVPELAHTYVSCPDCGSPDFEVVAGRGVWIESIEGVA